MVADSHDLPSATDPDKPIPVRSLRELIDIVSGRAAQSDYPDEDSGLAESLPYPFLALVGQNEMKLALLLALINPAIGGVLLVGPRGTGKTTAVRSLLNLLPDVEHSSCFYGCTAEDVETGGIDAICPNCAKKYAEGTPLSVTEPVRLVELPLNARLDDVVGGMDERTVTHERFRLHRGILARADKNILYVDEVNLLEDVIADSILDAAAQGSYTVRRGPMAATYKSRFTLIGSMNPEEGSLRPQIMDRFGLRILVKGLTEPEQRLEAYRRVHAFLGNPRRFVSEYSADTLTAREEIITARKLLTSVHIPDETARLGIDLIRDLEIDSLRAEITLFESARAYTAADNRTCVTSEDLRLVAPMALRLRRSEFIARFFSDRSIEDELIHETLERTLPNG